jgi:hypothetical protein
MLTITRAQLDMFGAVRRSEVTQRLAAMVAQHFPVQAWHAGDAAVAATAAQAIERGRTIGCVSERNAAHYLLLMCLLGHDFATDPRHRWAAEWLAERPGTTLRFRLEHMVELANHQLDAAQGPDNALLVRSLLRIRRLAPEDFAKAGTDPAQCAAWLGGLCPGWDAGQDGPVLAAVADAAPALAAMLGLDGPGPIATLALHAAILGHGFASDPLYPWAGEALSGNGSDRAERLFAASLGYVAAVLA